MRFGFEPAQDLGLQHVLQNGLSLIRGRDLEPGRRDQVLDGLLEIVADADRGSAALGAQSLTFALDQRPALERLSLFLRYLDEDTDQLCAKLAAARGVLEGMRAGQEIPDDAKAELEALLSRLLGAIERERALTPLLPPREIHYH